MEQEFRPYMDRNYPGINGINEKCNQYDKIDYTKAINYINQYKESNYKQLYFPTQNLLNNSSSNSSS